MNHHIELARLVPRVQRAIETVASPLVVSRVLGPAGTAASASRPLIVRCRGRASDEFVIKCIEWCRDTHPYLCANEWICGLLALQCGLPALDIMVVQHRDCLAVGWPRIPQAMWAAVGGHPSVLANLDNAEALYDMAAFDALIRNPDRHDGNVFARRVNPREPIYHLLVHDHDRAILPPGVRPATLNAQPLLDEPRWWVRTDGVRARLTERAALDGAVRRVRDACGGAAIMDIVTSTPSRWLPATDVQAAVLPAIRKVL